MKHLKRPLRKTAGTQIRTSRPTALTLAAAPPPPPPQRPPRVHPLAHHWPAARQVSAPATGSASAGWARWRGWLLLLVGPPGERPRCSSGGSFACQETFGSMHDSIRGSRCFKRMMENFPRFEVWIILLTKQDHSLDETGNNVGSWYFLISGRKWNPSDSRLFHFASSVSFPSSQHARRSRRVKRKWNPHDSSPLSGLLPTSSISTSLPSSPLSGLLA